jgi:glycosyltransferase involved in cell wall biosynthesis
MVTLIITTMNERHGLESIWPRIPFYLFKRILIVDNHSTDGTLDFLENDKMFNRYRCQVLQQTKPGRGNAIREAMQHVDDDSVMLISSDGNDQPMYIQSLAEKFNEGYDLVFGTRFANGGDTDDSDDPHGLRRFGNRVLTFLVNFFFGSCYSDSTYGFRIFKKSAWDKMGIDSEWNETEYMMSIRAARLGLKVAQIPMIEGKRAHGEVKAKTWRTGVNHLGVLVKEIFD